MPLSRITQKQVLARVTLNGTDGTSANAGDFIVQDTSADENDSLVLEENTDFDQLILEFYTPGEPNSGWVHVSYIESGNRKQSLTAMKENGKTVYKPGLIE